MGDPQVQLPVLIVAMPSNVSANLPSLSVLVSVAAFRFENLAQAVALVANAARTVADYLYEIRRQVGYDFKIAVFEGKSWL
jgi:hypothetical protein